MRKTKWIFVDGRTCYFMLAKDWEKIPKARKKGCIVSYVTEKDRKIAIKNNILSFLNLILLAFCTLSASAQTLPFYLRDKAHCAVNGVVIGVNASQIVVSNSINVAHDNTTYAVRYAPDRRGNWGNRYALQSVRVAQPSTTETVNVYTYLKGYPKWAQVRIGDRMAVQGDCCYLLGEAACVKTVQYFVAENSAAQIKVWR